MKQTGKSIVDNQLSAVEILNQEEKITIKNNLKCQKKVIILNGCDQIKM